MTNVLEGQVEGGNMSADKWPRKVTQQRAGLQAKPSCPGALTMYLSSILSSALFSHS